MHIKTLLATLSTLALTAAPALAGGVIGCPAAFPKCQYPTTFAERSYKGVRPVAVFACAAAAPRSQRAPTKSHRPRWSFVLRTRFRALALLGRPSCTWMALSRGRPGTAVVAFVFAKSRVSPTANPEIVPVSLDGVSSFSVPFAPMNFVVSLVATPSSTFEPAPISI